MGDGDVELGRLSSSVARRRQYWARRRRAVSDIVAVILLVAITVVLAAVSYVLATSLAHGPGSTPIGSAFTAGNPTTSNTIGSIPVGGADTCTAASTTLAAAIVSGDWTYTLTVESSTVTFGSVLFQVKTSVGTVAPIVGTGFYVVNVAGGIAACSLTAASGGLSMGGSVQFVYPAAQGLTSSSSLTNVYTIVIDMGTTQPTGLGYAFDAVGQGSFSGTTAPLSLP